jgi:cell division protein FtsQ
VPAVLLVSILTCIAAITFLGYRSVTASDFFDVKGIDVRGAVRTSREDLERLAATGTELTGTWRADLAEIKARIERLPFVKNAAVSRVLPDRILVTIEERVPAAIVRLKGGDMLIDAEGRLLAPASGSDTNLPFALLGWDEAKSERADKENAERLKMYVRMLSDWRQFDLASRVKEVDLADLREPRAITEDSGNRVSIALGRDNFTEHLKNGINAIAGKGDIFRGVDLMGQNMILQPRTPAKAEKQAE